MNRPELPSVIDVHNDDHAAIIETWARLDAEEIVEQHYDYIAATYERDRRALRKGWNDPEDAWRVIDEFYHDVEESFIRGQSISVPRELFRLTSHHDGYLSPRNASVAFSEVSNTYLSGFIEGFKNRFFRIKKRRRQEQMHAEQAAKTHAQRDPWYIPPLAPDERAERLPICHISEWDKQWQQRSPWMTDTLEDD